MNDPWKPFKDGFKAGNWNPFLLGIAIAALLFGVLSMLRP